MCLSVVWLTELLVHKYVSLGAMNEDGRVNVYVLQIAVYGEVMSAGRVLISHV